ncbi:MAG: hypothetical protein ACXWKD_07830, partial [Caldimonas sp.]
ERGHRPIQHPINPFVIPSTRGPSRTDFFEISSQLFDSRTLKTCDDATAACGLGEERSVFEVIAGDVKGLVVALRQALAFARHADAGPRG